MAKKINPKQHPLWPAFWRWAEANSCDSEYEEDWKVWWECFLAGATAFSNEFRA